VSDSRRVFRFAPSPNGHLHLGHALSALLNFELAQACGGRFLLRIEDIDRARAKPQHEAAIYEDLAWLGLVWEEPVRRQSEHFGDYADALERLDALGLVYPCACTRAEIAQAAGPNAPRDPDGAPLYPGTCRAKQRRPAREVLRAGGAALRLDIARALALLGAPPSLRAERSNPGAARDSWIASPAARNDGGLAWREFGVGEVAAHPEHWGDVVLARKDTPASYHLAVTVDDALQGVTDVVRGADLFAATSIHRLLQRLLDLPAPDYRHHALLRDAAGEKLAKSRASKPLRTLREEGLNAAAVRQEVDSALRASAPNAQSSG